MKKLFPEEKGYKKRIREFLDKKGFYIVLILCIAVVAGTAVYVTTRNVTPDNLNYDSQNIIPEDTNSGLDSGNILDSQEPEGTPASAIGPSAIADDEAKAGTKENTKGETKTPAAEEDNPGTAKNATDKTTPAPATSAKPKTTTPKTTAAVNNNASTPAKNQNFIMPVFGDITFEYAMDKLVYSKTLEEWRTHDGLDLAADRGTPVKAAADGVVSEIKNDPRYGVVVVIDHGNGLKTVYANLASDDMVATNQKVKQGDIIGCIGNTAIFESAEPAHLHFEVLKDEKNVDPTAYLPESPDQS